MRFVHRQVHSLEDAQRNFEQIEQQNTYTGSGAPTFIPTNKAVSYYFRMDPSLGANTRLYYFNGTSWAGIA